MLASTKISPAKADSPQPTHEEVTEYLKELPGWQTTKEEDISKLRKTYFFKEYKQAVEFVNRLAAEADKHDHHPLIVLEWGRVTVSWWTHVLRGLHLNDFIMAAHTERLSATS